MSEYDYSNEPQLKGLQAQKWQAQKWQPRDALLHKTSNRTTLFVGQKYDPEKIEFLSEGWTHDHCEICYQELYYSEEPKFGYAFTNGQEWICSECYLKYMNKQ